MNIMFLKPMVFLVCSQSFFLYADTDDLPAKNSRPLEEVVVTAQRRTEPLQHVPIAVTAFDDDEIEMAGIATMNNLSLHTPGFVISNYNKTTPQFFIRGIGSNASGASDDSSVALFIDDVYISRPGSFDGDIFSVDSIEVLRGPQGTLYGKNVVGGVIKVTSKKPSDDATVKLATELGHLDHQNLQAYVNAPLGMNAAGNFSVSRQRRDGFVKNTVTEEKERDEDSVSLRGRLEFCPDDDTELSLILDSSKGRLNGSGRVLMGELFFGLPAPSLNDLYRTDTPVVGFTDSDSQGISFSANINTTHWRWTAISAYRKNDYSFEEDIIPTQLIRTVVNLVDEESQQFSQEIRVTNHNSGEHEFTAGMYYLNEYVDRIESWDLRELAVLFGVPASVASGEIDTFDANNKTNSYAVFSQWDYHFTDTMTLSLGGRYTRESKEFKSCATGSNLLDFNFLIEPYCNVDETDTWTDFSPKTVLMYEPRESLHWYLSYTKGFKSGAFNSLADSRASAVSSVDPESANQFELGLKSIWFDKSLRLNAVVFTIDYDDLQVFVVAENGSFFVENAAEAT